MAFQFKLIYDSVQSSSVDQLVEVQGSDLIGMKIKAPFANHAHGGRPRIAKARNEGTPLISFSS